MAGFSAAETEFLLNAAFAFFWGKLGDLDRVHDHGVWVVGLGMGGVREGVVGLVGRPQVSFGNVVGSLPLSLESNGLLVPFINGGRDGVHGHDSAHERGGIPAEKYPIRMLGSEMLARATWFLKVEMYSVREGE